MVAFFLNRLNWERNSYSLTPNEIRRNVEDRPGVYMLWISPPTLAPTDELGELAVYSHPRGDPKNVIEIREYLNSRTKLAYIGQSTKLQTRLTNYAMAVNPDRPPVYQVVRDRVMGRPRLAHDYLISSPSGMRALRRQWMEERNLHFQVAYTEDERAARDAEKTMISYCVTHGLVLWNSVLYQHSPTWPH